jgi:adenine-specific DNA methylase
MRFIEKTLPVEYLNPVAMAEGNAKKPVYRMHKWWARRLGSVFRMIALATFSTAGESEQSIWHRFCEGVDLEGKIVLDPFMGGGTTVVEALRLGCKVIGADINPVAWFITKKEIEPVDPDTLNLAYQYLDETAGSFIREYYKTRCLCGELAEVMYFFWVKVAECAGCRARVRLFPNYELSCRDRSYICFCPDCLQIIETKEYQPETMCPHCQRLFDPRKGVAGRGIFRCSYCGMEQRILDAVESRKNKLDEELHALEGYCQSCGRFFKRVDDGDMALWERAKEDFNHYLGRLLIPDQLIPVDGRSDRRPVNHGYRYFQQMFNERQLLCLATLLEAILKISDPNIREMMLIAFSDSLDTNTMFCKYEVQWHKISPFFGFHAYHPIERPTENNVWGTAYGRGTFTKCFEKVRRAKEYCQKPHERLSDSRGRRFSKKTGKEQIKGQIVGTFQELLRTEQAALLQCRNSEDLSFVPDRSVDAVITDPPYFDNVQYSELADFFYVWLRLALKGTYPWFEPDYSGCAAEIIQNDKAGKTAAFFNHGLQKVFSECCRVLKDDGVMVFTFHHNKVCAWENTAMVLLDSGFYVSASPVVRSEGKSGFHSSGGNIRYDAVLVCRKQKRFGEEFTGEDAGGIEQFVSGEESGKLKQRVLADAIAWGRKTFESGMAVSSVDIFTITMAKSIEHLTKVYAGLDCKGGVPCINVFLNEMKEIINYIAEKARQEAKTYEVRTSGAEQLVLLLKESELRYGKKTAQKLEKQV